MIYNFISRMSTTCPGETTMLRPNRFHLVVSSLSFHIPRWSHYGPASYTAGPYSGIITGVEKSSPSSSPWSSSISRRARIAMSNVHTFWHANCAFICASLCWTLVFRHFSKLKSIADKVPRGDRSGTIPGPRGLMDRCETNS